MLPPFGQDVASVTPFSRRLASLPLRQAVTTNRKDLKPSFTEGRNPFRFPWGKEQRLGYLQQRCTQWSRWAPKLANLRWGGRKVATSCIAFICHALACVTYIGRNSTGSTRHRKNQRLSKTPPPSHQRKSARFRLVTEQREVATRRFPRDTFIS